MTWAPNTVTVASMITGARQNADMQNTQFCTDLEIVKYLNLGYRKLYNHIVNTFQNYYVSESTTSLVSGTAEYDLPTDFLKLIGVDLVQGTVVTSTLTPWSFSQRNRLVTAIGGTPTKYILNAGKIKLLPTPASSDSMIIYYVPAPVEFTSVSSVQVFNGFDEYIMLDAAIKMKQKEESDVSILVGKQAEMLRIIIESMQGVDASFPQRMTDVERLNDNVFPFGCL